MIYDTEKEVYFMGGKVTLYFYVRKGIKEQSNVESSLNFIFFRLTISIKKSILVKII